MMTNAIANKAILSVLLHYCMTIDVSNASVTDHQEELSKLAKWLLKKQQFIFKGAEDCNNVSYPSNVSYITYSLQ